MAEPGYYSTPMGPAGPKKKPEKPPKTMRFALDLADSDELSCPEFSWLKLLREAAENDEQKMLECLDPFAAKDLEEQKKLEALARTFEEKYKSANAGKRRKKIHLQDLWDMGDGYDENDPFVDNSEAYDELVPETLTTKLGGFYINSGQLDFKELSVDYSDEEVQPMKKKKKKRPLTIDSDSGSNDDCNFMKKKRFLKKALKDAVKSSDSDSAARASKKRRKSEKKRIFTGNILLKRQKLEKAKKLKRAALDSRVPCKHKPSENGVKPTLNGAKLMESLDSTFAEVLGQCDSPKPPMPTVTPKTSPSKSGDMQQDGETPKLCPENTPALPELEPAMKTAIERIKEAARGCQDGKQKFFSDEVNRLLLSIEIGSRQYTCGQRSTIYSHLAAHLPCGKDTLLKRAKKLRESDQGAKLQDPKDRLKEAINRIMPEQMERYEQSIQVASMAKNEDPKDLSQCTDAANSTAESDLEDEKKENGDDKRRVPMPRKRFQWSGEVRQLLGDLVSAKMELFEVSKHRTQTAEDYLKSYLDTEIRGLWPRGWMQTRMLFKESKSAHAQWTIGIGKLKKNPSVVRLLSTTPTNSQSGSRLDKSKTETKIEVKSEVDELKLFDMLDEEAGDAKPDGDTASMLSSFLESEVLNMDTVKVKVKPEEITKAKMASVTPKERVMPPPKPASSDHSFMAQFEKFMRQNSNERSPEKSGSQGGRAVYPPAVSPTVSPHSSSSSSQDMRMMYQGSPDEIRSPPKAHTPGGHGSPSAPSMRAIMSHSSAASEYMNSFAKFTQQQQQATNRKSPLQQHSQKQNQQPSLQPHQQPKQQQIQPPQRQQQPHPPQQKHQQQPHPPQQKHQQQPHPPQQKHQQQPHPLQQKQQQPHPPQQKHQQQPHPLQQKQQQPHPPQQKHQQQPHPPQQKQQQPHPPQQKQQQPHPPQQKHQQQPHLLQQKHQQQQQLALQQKHQQQPHPPQQKHQQQPHPLQQKHQQQQQSAQQQKHQQQPSGQQSPPKRSIWSPASGSMPAYISPISGYSAKLHASDLSSLSRPNLAAAMTSSTSNMTSSAGNMSTSAAQRERNLYDMFTDQVLAAQRQPYMDPTTMALMAASAMKSPSGVYGLSTSPGVQSPHHSPQPSQGLFSGHRSPVSQSSPPRHPLLQHSTLPQHPYRQYAQDEQPRPY